MRHPPLGASGAESTSKRPPLVITLALALLLSELLGAAGENHSPPTSGLGRVDFQVSCSEDARIGFNQAAALLHHMTYPQARAAFEEVARADPSCAMAHWGIAMTLFQPSWPTRPGPAELARGWQAVQHAYSLEPPTERERLFIAATEAFFLDPASTDYWLRIRRWERAMAALHSAYPDDPEAAAFYALAHLAAAPAGEVTQTYPERAAQLLLKVYEQNPDHPGAMHYLVHANDAPGREGSSLEIVRKYETVAPANPHALHMPTHIYTRLGDWDAVIRGNVRAAEAALAHPAGERGELVSDEYPHAVEYLVYAHLQKGTDEDAARAIESLRATADLQPSLKTAFHLASTAARYALERREWGAAAQIEPRQPASLDWDRFRWPEAIARFAAGLGSTRLGSHEPARAAVAHLERLEAAAAEAGEELFARNIGVLRLELEAWLAHGEGNAELSVRLMAEAADIEVSTPKHAVTPGPTLPAFEQLGDLLLEQGHPSDALHAYSRSLELYPRRLNSLLGAARSASESGDESLAAAHYRQLLETAGTGTRPALEEARAFVQALD